MTLAADPHFLHLQTILSSKAEGDWHDFKEGVHGRTDELLKDLVALANTAGGPYGGYGYLIIGIDDDGNVRGLIPKETELNEDARQRQLGSAAAHGITPLMSPQVKGYTVEGRRIHLVIVPQTSDRWHVVTGSQNHGYWVRRDRASVRPTAEQLEEHFQERLKALIGPVHEQLLRMDGRIGQLRTDLAAAQDPALLSAAEHARIAFQTPDRTFLRLIRQEASTFLDRRGEHLEAIQRVHPDRLVDQPTWHDADRDALRDLVERLEQDTRPLIEAVGALIHDAEPTARTEQALLELNAVFTDASVHMMTLPPSTFALWVYPALLYLHAVAASATPHLEWQLFGQVIHHVQDVPSPRLTRRSVALASVVPWRETLDGVMRVIEPGSPPRAAAHRMERLLRQSDWIGQTLPVLGRLGAFSRSEAALTLGYVAAALKRQGHVPPSFAALWWTYLNANGILEETIQRFVERGSPVLAGLKLRDVAAAFDSMDKPGSYLTVQAQYLVDVGPQP
ncbi:hypothetical protein HNQ07_004074 [Deinococcus metalli]|uniref:Schlafen AlbA-2 domain-containing protein n=1 Tax=Deinococcus metalli TaxID=1141878 RepID=A0A7W8KI20_9DEIO|nr:ATP-binding protein [Deinococcus metalli]MBB5378567.1 hypothetical protein [Deinococcus metalli]GHF58675.1 hypothetical protein GCM10017781_38700 [Deinococcus metalli]